MDEQALFDQALATPPSARAAFLEEACAGDPGLRQRLEVLLHAHEHPGSFLGGPALGLAATVAEPRVSERPGTVIGAYKLMEQIGEGGMGLVFVAEQQQPVRRKVAVKVIKPGMDTRQVIARFEAERQALALMDHPNIAKVLDGGETANGRPYFVMELVKGIPVTQFCNDNRLTTRERLELFLPICQAVQHAHQKGIIHRDIKPSNVLVMSHDGTPVIKVIDFGVAKAVGQQLTDKTIYTQFAQLVGTPLYMSPEQAGQSGLDVDTRSDIYSLGVLLYELLAGTTPFDKERFKKAAYDEIRRIIREEEPPKPSTRISTLGQAATTVSTQRKSDPRRLTQLFRGELDWIVMRCLEKDRNRRYETASAFAQDLQRYLTDEPVQACPPTVGYRLRKFVRRNKGPVVAASLVFLALLIGIIGTALALFESKRQEGLALAAQRREANRAEAEARQRRFARKAVDEMYFQVAQKWLAEQPRMEKVQRDFLKKALSYYEEFALAHSSDPQERLETGYAYFGVGEIQYKLGRYDEAEKAYRQANSLFRSLPTEDGSVASYRNALLRSHTRLGGVLYARSQFQEAEKVYRQGVEVGQLLVADFPKEFDHWLEYASNYNGLGMSLDKMGRFEDAEYAYRQSLDIKLTKVEVVPKRPEYLRELAADYRSLGNVLRSTNRLRDAEQAHRKSVAHLEQLVGDFPKMPGHREDLTMSRGNLAGVLKETNQLPEAIKVQGQALDTQTVLVKDFPDVPQYQRTLAASLMNFAIFLKANGQRDKAEEAYNNAVAVAEKLLSRFESVPEYRQLLAKCQFNLGNLLRETDRLKEAEQVYERALPLQKALAEKFPGVPTYRRELSNTYSVLSLVLFRTNRPGEGQKACRKAIEMDPNNVKVKNTLSWSLATCADPKLRKPSEAVALAQEAIEQAKQNPDYWVTLGVAQYRAGDWKASLTALETAAQLSKDGETAESFFLAMVHWRLGNKEEARRRYDRAAAWMEKNSPRDEALLRFRAEAAALLNHQREPSVHE